MVEGLQRGLGLGMGLLLRSGGGGGFSPDPTVFESEPQTITIGGTLTIPHGLGSAPIMVQPSIECVSADSNYSVGDRVVISMNMTDSIDINRFTSVYWDATNIKVKYSASSTLFYITNATTGNGAAITLDSWRFYVTAIAPIIP